ncbi:MAG: EVE domain-containing protein [Planctomyces sp.]|nr:EVE domain-containing protein [Planctomyces sp.]
MPRPERRFWLFKSEPESYSIDDLKRDGRTFWDGIRNYQVRNFLRDDVRVGDGVLFYNSNADPMAVTGTMTVVSAGYPDHTQFDPRAKHYDPASREDSPTWFMVDVEFERRFDPPVTRDMLKCHAGLAGMGVLQKGSRLSVTPVTAEEWRIIHQIAGVSDGPAKKLRRTKT